MFKRNIAFFDLAFRKIPQGSGFTATDQLRYLRLWKFEGEPPGRPSNTYNSIRIKRSAIKEVFHLQLNIHLLQSQGLP